MKPLTSEQIRQFICGYLDIDYNTFAVLRLLLQQMDVYEAYEDAKKKEEANNVG